MAEPEPSTRSGATDDAGPGAPGDRPAVPSAGSAGGPEGVGVRWMWLFLDVPRESAEPTWAFWGEVTRCSVADRRGEVDEFATLQPQSGDPWVKLQAVGGPRGVHLDLDVDDPVAAADLAIGLGASEVRRVLDETGGFVTLRSPGGFVFCLTHAGSPATQQRSGEPDLLDQLCLDVPGEHFASEVGFWSALTGWPVRAEHAEEEFRALARPDGMPVRILVQRLGEPSGPVRGHLDLASGDRAATVARHVAAGATAVREHQYWTVMRDPAGGEYCVTEREVRSGTLLSTPA